MSFHHINQPNQSFLDQESRLDRKFSIHAGHKVMFTKGRRLRTVAYQFQERSATFAVNYKKQGGLQSARCRYSTLFSASSVGGMVSRYTNSKC